MWQEIHFLTTWTLVISQGWSHKPTSNLLNLVHNRIKISFSVLGQIIVWFFILIVLALDFLKFWIFYYTQTNSYMKTVNSKTFSVNKTKVEPQDKEFKIRQDYVRNLTCSIALANMFKYLLILCPFWAHPYDSTIQYDYTGSCLFLFSVNYRALGTISHALRLRLDFTIDNSITSKKMPQVIQPKS